MFNDKIDTIRIKLDQRPKYYLIIFFADCFLMGLLGLAGGMIIFKSLKLAMASFLGISTLALLRFLLGDAMKASTFNKLLPFGYWAPRLILNI
jgi:hypothetical protein